MTANPTNVLFISFKLFFLLLIVAVAISFASFSTLIREPILASAITIDLIFTLPIAFWLFFRKTKFLKSAIPVIAPVGFAVALVILPADNRTLFNYLLYYVVPLLELVFIAYAVHLIYRARKTFRSLNDQKKDFSESIRETLVREFPYPFMAKALAFEIAGFYYLIFKWKTKTAADRFSYHKKNGVTALLFVFAFIVVAETLVFHFLIAKWSVIAAWILTLSSIYLIFQILAHLKAIILRPVEFTGDILHIRCGLMGDAEIEIGNIKSISIKDQDETITERLLPLGNLIKGNITICTNTESQLIGFYGKKRSFTNLEVYIDEPEKFVEELGRRIDKN